MAKRQSFDAGDVVYWRPMKRRAKWVPRGEEKPVEEGLAKHADGRHVKTFSY